MVELLVEARIGLAEASEIENRQEQHSLEPNTANFRPYMLSPLPLLHHVAAYIA